MSRDLALLVGRLLLAALFIFSGYAKIGGFEGTAAFIASKGLPLPQLGAALTIALELGGGLLIAVGFKTRWAALALALFLVPLTVIFHAYWSAPAAQASADYIAFWKNMSILGGMLVLWAAGPGRWSVDRG